MDISTSGFQNSETSEGTEVKIDAEEGSLTVSVRKEGRLKVMDAKECSRVACDSGVGSGTGKKKRL